MLRFYNHPFPPLLKKCYLCVLDSIRSPFCTLCGGFSIKSHFIFTTKLHSTRWITLGISAS